MQPPKPTDTHIVVRATEKSPDFPEGALRFSAKIKKGTPLIDYVPAQAFRESDAGWVVLAWEPKPKKEKS